MIKVEPALAEDWHRSWPVWRKLWQSELAEASEALGSALAGWTGARETEQRWLARLPDVLVNITRPDADGAFALISMWLAPEARVRDVGDEAVGRASTRTEPDRPIVHPRWRRRSIKASNSRENTTHIAPSSMMKLPEAAVPAADECGPPPPQTFWPRPVKTSSTLRVSSVYTTHGRSNRFNRVPTSGLMTGVEPVLESSTRNVPMPSDGRVKQFQGPAV